MSHSDIHGISYSGIAGLFAGLQLRRLGFDSRPVHVHTPLVKKTSGKVSLEELWFCPVRIFLQILCILIQSIYHQHYVISATDSVLKFKASLPPMHGITCSVRYIGLTTNFEKKLGSLLNFICFLRYEQFEKYIFI
jgi:hypothetical protein